VDREGAVAASHIAAEQLNIQGTAFFIDGEPELIAESPGQLRTLDREKKTDRRGAHRCQVADARSNHSLRQCLII